MAIITTGDLRRELAAAIEKAAQGKLNPQDGKNIIGLATQITASMMAEVQLRKFKMDNKETLTEFGQTAIGVIADASQKTIEVLPSSCNESSIHKDVEDEPVECGLSAKMTPEKCRHYKFSANDSCRNCKGIG